MKKRLIASMDNAEGLEQMFASAPNVIEQRPALEGRNVERVNVVLR